MSPKGLPDRWMDYSPMGDIIPNTRFICMKVPLKPSLLHSVSEDSTFSCEHAIDMVTQRGRKLGLVIDLTFTTRYYDPLCFEKENIQYKKIFMPGRVIPEQSIMQEFYNAVEDYEENNRANDHLIAVHCTHGLNRTGYMICKYMIEKKGIDAESAISMFEDARGHKMERELYLADLKGEAIPDIDKNSPVKWKAQPPDRYQGHDSPSFNHIMQKVTHRQDPHHWHPYRDHPYQNNASYYQNYYPHPEQTYRDYNDYRYTPTRSHYRRYEDRYEGSGYGHTQAPSHDRRFYGYKAHRYEGNHGYDRRFLLRENQPSQFHGPPMYRSERFSKSRHDYYDRP